jgi:hypothetical protein
MTKRFLLLGVGTIGVLMLAGPTAAQSYMQRCNRLISEWTACDASGEACRPQYSAIEEECRCHTFRRGEWVLVTAAVGEDNVCDAHLPDDPPGDLEIPPPPPPPGRNIIDERRDGGHDDGEGRPNAPSRSTSSSARTSPQETLTR